MANFILEESFPSNTTKIDIMNVERNKQVCTCGDLDPLIPYGEIDIS